jgi:roadblock/LC7 domain-containing protein
MAGHHVTDGAIREVDNPIETFLSELGARMPGPRHRREQILAELRDGLVEATDKHAATGLAAEQAAAAAVAQFGSPQAVADAFAPELATAYARRTIAWYIATGPLVGIWWLLLMHPHPWRTGLIGLLAAIPVLPLIVLAIVAAGGTFATTGRLMRWFPETSPRRALTATAVIAAVCVIGDLTMLGVLAASASPLRPLAAVAVTASLTRVACSITVIREAITARRRCQAT